MVATLQVKPEFEKKKIWSSDASIHLEQNVYGKKDIYQRKGEHISSLKLPIFQL